MSWTRKVKKKKTEKNEIHMFHCSLSQWLHLYHFLLFLYVSSPIWRRKMCIIYWCRSKRKHFVNELSVVRLCWLLDGQCEIGQLLGPQFTQNEKLKLLNSIENWEVDEMKKSEQRRKREKRNEIIRLQSTKSLSSFIIHHSSFSTKELAE